MGGVLKIRDASQSRASSDSSIALTGSESSAKMTFNLFIFNYLQPDVWATLDVYLA